MPVRGIGTDPSGAPPPVRLCNYVLASYTAAGTSAPADGDIVSYSSAGNDRIVMCPDDTTKLIGRVKGDPNTTDLTVQVEWLDVVRFVEVDCDDATTATLLNAAIKDGNTTVVNNFDAGSTTGGLKVISKSGTSGAITMACAVLAGG